MKDIKGYEGLYAITSCGKVWSYISNKFLKQKIDKDGYCTVNLYKDKKRKTKKIHRLVAEAYLENPNNLPEVNHKDEIKTNNSIQNLEWCSTKYNRQYGTRIQRATEKTRKKVICIETEEVYDSVKEAHKQTGISMTGISLCCNEKRKSAGGLHWKFAEKENV